MTIAQAIHAHLTASPVITAIFGSRIGQEHLPATGEFPALLFDLGEFTLPTHDMDDPSTPSALAGQDRVRDVEIDFTVQIKPRSAEAATVYAYQVMAAMVSINGAYSGLRLSGCRVESRDSAIWIAETKTMQVSFTMRLIAALETAAA
jgi:hypothetical protein